MRVIPLQLPLAPEWSAGAPAAGVDGWRTLDERRAGRAGDPLAGMPLTLFDAPADTGAGFWAIEPYVGCELGCTAPCTHAVRRYAVERTLADGRLDRAVAEEFVGLEGWEAFERRILAPGGTERTAVRSRSRKRAPTAPGDRPIVIGTAADPYQPAERRLGLTRRILERLARHRGLSIAIITTSPLVARDLALLQHLSARNDLIVAVALPTLDPLLARRLEPRAPAPRARLRALAQLVAGGLEAGLLIAPVLPRLTDGARDLARLVDAARTADAKWVMGSTLRLDPAARARFAPYLADVFPELAERYRRQYARRTRADEGGRGRTGDAERRRVPCAGATVRPRPPSSALVRPRPPENEQPTLL